MSLPENMTLGRKDVASYQETMIDFIDEFGLGIY